MERACPCSLGGSEGEGRGEGGADGTAAVKGGMQEVVDSGQVGNSSISSSSMVQVAEGEGGGREDLRAGMGRKVANQEVAGNGEELEGPQDEDKEEETQWLGRPDYLEGTPSGSPFSPPICLPYLPLLLTVFVWTV